MKTLSKDSLLKFLQKVDCDFPVPLSKKVDLCEYALKLIDNATIFYRDEEGQIVSLIAGYTNGSEMAYIAILATQRQFRGKKYAESLLNEFISFCKGKKLKAVHLYAVESNKKAVALYEKIGFSKWVCDDEPRPNDLHLILYLK